MSLAGERAGVMVNGDDNKPSMTLTLVTPIRTVKKGSSQTYSPSGVGSLAVKQAPNDHGNRYKQSGIEVARCDVYAPNYTRNECLALISLVLV